jgi:hypothetical protein
LLEAWHLCRTQESGPVGGVPDGAFLRHRQPLVSIRGSYAKSCSTNELALFRVNAGRGTKFQAESLSETSLLFHEIKIALIGFDFKSQCLSTSLTFRMCSKGIAHLDYLY